MEPKRDIRFGDVVARRQPPVVGYWCSPPTATKAHNARCAYANDACGPGSSACPLCYFPFCDAHLGRHSRRFECPVDVWRVFNKRRRYWYKRVAKNPKSKPKVDVGFPDADPEARDG